MADDSDEYSDLINADEAVFETELAVLEALMGAIANTESRYMAAEFRRITKAKGIIEHASEMTPYLFAAAYVSYAGREIDSESVGAVLRAAGFVPDRILMQLLEAGNVKSHLIYVYSYYFLVALGKAGTAEEMMNLVKALGMEADESRANDVLLFLKTPKK